MSRSIELEVTVRVGVTVNQYDEIEEVEYINDVDNEAVVLDALEDHNIGQRDAAEDAIYDAWRNG